MRVLVVVTPRDWPGAHVSPSRQLSRKWLWLPWVALFLFVIAPLYLAAAALAWRADLLTFSGGISDEQFKAIIAFLGTSLAATATLATALLTRSHNLRTLAFQENVEAEARVARQAESNRLNLDTVVRGLELIGTGDSYAPKAKVAGALATLVHLGHPVIAMLALGSAWQEGKVDCDTGCWLISQTLQRGSEPSAVEAVALLVRHAGDLVTDAHPSQMSWPDALWADWPSHRTENVRLTALEALCQVLLARPSDSMTKLNSIAARVAYTAMSQDPDETIQRHAAEIFILTTEDTSGTVTWVRDLNAPTDELLVDVREEAMAKVAASTFVYMNLGSLTSQLRAQLAASEGA
jgi:hypothetical protein